jgi:sulfide:quinone oxidoreductase
MTARPHLDDEPLRVVVAGGGVTGLETLVALRGLVGHRAALTLVAPQEHFVVRALELFEPFGVGRPQRYPLAELTDDLDATFVRDAVIRVQRDERVVHLQSGGDISYDVLVLAVGASAHRAYDHGASVTGPDDADGLDAVVADARAGDAQRIAVVVPPACRWSLPAYELVLMLAAFTKPQQLTLVTAEHEPLGVFGAPAAALARAELAAAGVDLLTGVEAAVPGPTLVALSAGARLTCDRIVALPLLSGPSLLGLPCDDEGFIVVDGAFRVGGADDLFAVGDAATGAYKQGGLAAQQADVVADQIAWRAGAEHPPRPYRPILRGLLRTAAGPRYLRAEPPGGGGSAEVSDTCLWWPPSKIAARWLTPWLAARDGEDRLVPQPRRLPSGGISRTSAT